MFNLIPMIRTRSSYVFWLVILCSVGKVQAQSLDFSKLYKAGVTLYVVAADGLMMNEKPGMNATKIKMFPYGSQVVVQKDSHSQGVALIDNISGHWVRVKSDSAMGYMFDGYLSRWLPVSEREALKSYLDKISRIRTTDKKSPQASIRDYEKITYENGLSYESRIFETGSIQSIAIPQNLITLRETYLLAISLFPSYKNTICKYDPAGMRCSDGSDRLLTVRKEGNSFVIKEEVKE